MWRSRLLCHRGRRLDVRGIALRTRMIENAAQKVVEDLRDASGAFGEMFGCPSRRRITAIEVMFKRTIATLRAHLFLFGLERCETSFMARAKGNDLILLHPSQPFGGRGLLPGLAFQLGDQFLDVIGP